MNDLGLQMPKRDTRLRILKRLKGTALKIGLEFLTCSEVLRILTLQPAADNLLRIRPKQICGVRNG